MEQELTPHDLQKAAQRPKGMVSVSEILAYLETDRYMDKHEAAAYLSLSTRTLDYDLHEISHFRVGRKVLFKKSELDQWMERHRESGGADLNKIADEVVEQVLRDAS